MGSNPGHTPQTKFEIETFLAGLHSKDPTVFSRSVEWLCKGCLSTHKPGLETIQKATETLLNRLSADSHANRLFERDLAWKGIMHAGAISLISARVRDAAWRELASIALDAPMERLIGPLQVLGFREAPFRAVAKHITSDELMLSEQSSADATAALVERNRALARVISAFLWSETNPLLSQTIDRGTAHALVTPVIDVLRKSSQQESSLGDERFEASRQHLIRACGKFLTSMFAHRLMSDEQELLVSRLLRGNVHILADEQLDREDIARGDTSWVAISAFTLALRSAEVHPVSFILEAALKAARTGLAARGRLAKHSVGENDKVESPKTNNVNLGPYHQAIALLALGNDPDTYLLDLGEAHDLRTLCAHPLPLISICARWAKSRVDRQPQPQIDYELVRTISEHPCLALLAELARGTNLGFVLNDDSPGAALSGLRSPRRYQSSSTRSPSTRSMGSGEIQAAFLSYPKDPQGILQVDRDALECLVCSTVERHAIKLHSESGSVGLSAKLTGSDIYELKVAFMIIGDPLSGIAEGRLAPHLAGQLVSLAEYRFLDQKLLLNAIAALGSLSVNACFGSGAFAQSLPRDRATTERLLRAFSNIPKVNVFNDAQIGAVLKELRHTSDIGVRTACYQLLAREDCILHSGVHGLARRAERDADTGAYRCFMQRVAHVWENLFSARAITALPWGGISEGSAELWALKKAAQQFREALRY